MNRGCEINLRKPRIARIPRMRWLMTHPCDLCYPWFPSCHYLGAPWDLGGDVPCDLRFLRLPSSAL
jgi:hypothetical protein